MIGRLARQPAPIVLLVLALAALVVATMAILVVPDRAEAILRWLLVVISVLVIVGAIHAIAARFPIDWRPPAAFASQPAPEEQEAPQRLREIERLVAYSEWDAADFHARLRPVLRQIAAGRLAGARTIDIDANPDAARAALGDRVWSLLAAKDPRTIRRDGGISRDDLQAIVATLEALDDRPHA